MSNKILIISYYWPPSGGSGVQRWVNFSNKLSLSGCEVTVITAQNPNYPVLDNKLDSIINKSVKVIKIPIFDPTALIKRKNSDNISVNNKIFSKILLWIRANLFFPDSRMFWIKKVSKQATDYIKKNNVKCLITSAPPFSTHIIGQNVKNNTNVRWISDFRDPWSDFFQFKLLPLKSFMKKKHFKAELNTLKLSDAVITTSPSLTKKYSLINENSFTVFNGFNSFVKTKSSKKFTLMYSGIMKTIQNPKFFWLVLIDICKTNKSFFNDLCVRFIGDFDNEIINHLKDSSIESKVTFEKYLEKENLDKEMSAANVLILCTVNLNTVKNVIPGKLYYYFSLNRPIIAFSNLDSDLNEIITKTNSGKVFDYLNEIDLKNHILELYSEYKSGKNNYNPKNTGNYTYDTLSKKLNEIINKTID
jgi:glycosyltransferase involved in cell wall biosynthesis